MKLKKYFSVISVITATLILIGCDNNNSSSNANNNRAEQIAQIKEVLAEAKEQYGLSAILYGVWGGEQELVTGA